MEMSTTRVLVSILNWHAPERTVAAVARLLDLHPPDLAIELLVIDNGSSIDEFETLQRHLSPTVTLRRNETNLGYAGGHNQAIRLAMEQGFDYIWLFNNDASVLVPETLPALVRIMEHHPGCAAVSPRLEDDDGRVYFNGGEHDWKNRLSTWPSLEKMQKLEGAQPLDRWLSGAALLLRVAALKKVGLLDERYFAYYEDNELSVRLAKAGWDLKVAFDTRVRHPLPAKDTERQPYYFYLTQRNYLLFWYENTPQEYRHLLWLRLLDQALYNCNRLYDDGFTAHGNASLLGIRDFIAGRLGRPELDRHNNLLLVGARKLTRFRQRLMAAAQTQRKL
jgi:GT2 family glycosyltransferase